MVEALLLNANGSRGAVLLVMEYYEVGQFFIEKSGVVQKGKLIQSVQKKEQEPSLSLDLADLPQGIYFIRAGQHIQKVVKEGLSL